MEKELLAGEKVYVRFYGIAARGLKPEELVAEGVIEKVGKNYSVQIPEMQGTELRFQKRFDPVIWGYRQTHTGSMEYAMFQTREEAEQTPNREEVLKWFKEFFTGEKILNFSSLQLSNARASLLENASTQKLSRPVPSVEKKGMTANESSKRKALFGSSEGTDA